ncbi:MAG TPA: hypothetical protein VD997_12970 [Phycisphaerales bacterium]|nr:hypothetical protein [Phycisphaerales bacterium]
MNTRACLGVLCLCGVVSLNVGCRGGAQPKPADEGSVIQRGALPAYDAVANGYNRRVTHLERLEALVALNVTAVNQKGEQISNQVEGNLKVMLPASVSLRVDKVGKPVFYLGSNEQQYWWIDLTQDPKVAMVGAHAKATPEAVNDFGIPVHPMDLIEVLAIKPLPQPGSDEAHQARLAWSANGRALVVTLPGRWGERRFSLHPETFAPIRIELLDGQGSTVVSCVHTDFQPVEVVGNTTVRPQVTKRIDLSLPVQKATVTVSVYEPRNPGQELRVQVFNLQAVLQNFNIRNVVDIDQARAQNQDPAPAAGERPSAGVLTPTPGAEKR